MDAKTNKFVIMCLLKGFCCWCTEQDKWRGSFDSHTPFSRAGLACKLFTKAQAAAHCMKYNDLWCVQTNAVLPPSKKNTHKLQFHLVYRTTTKFFVLSLNEIQFYYYALHSLNLSFLLGSSTLP